MSKQHKQAAADLRRFIDVSNQLHQQYVGNPAVFRIYERFVELQLGYFLPRYDDLLERPGYSAAVHFVVSDLTGPGIANRDRDLARVEPIMSRFLPAAALDALALAMQLNSRVLAINLEIADRLAALLNSGDEISERTYCMASRHASSFAECQELIAMTRRAGEQLDHFAHLPMIRTLLHSMKLPARLGGVGDLHAFLEKGLDTFVGVPDVHEFLDVMEGRMTDVFYRVFEEDLEVLEDTPLAA